MLQAGPGWGIVTGEALCHRSHVPPWKIADEPGLPFSWQHLKSKRASICIHQFQASALVMSANIILAKTNYIVQQIIKN